MWAEAQDEWVRCLRQSQLRRARCPHLKCLHLARRCHLHPWRWAKLSLTFCQRASYGKVEKLFMVFEISILPLTFIIISANSRVRCCVCSRWDDVAEMGRKEKKSFFCRLNVIAMEKEMYTWDKSSNATRTKLFTRQKSHKYYKIIIFLLLLTLLIHSLLGYAVPRDNETESTILSR